MRLELTRRADYAIRAVIALASLAEPTPVPVPRIAERMAIPARFLPQIMRDLGRAGIVEATLGRGGGYRLAREPERLSLLDVIEAVEGDARRRVCVLRSEACGPDDQCDVHRFFAAAQDALLMQLAAATIAEVIHKAPGPTEADATSEALSSVLLRA